jgi:dihydrofolate synthase / folylpolyglutamate synthase
MFNQLPMFHRIGAAAYKANLDNTHALCKLTGHPEKTFLSIHIAGTNGKGSVSHLLASVLQASGLRVGLYTSPHLRDFRERIRINGKMIPKSFVTKFISDHKEDFEKLKPSFFEMTFIMAMVYFATEKPDIVIVEAGMGGRLDSTNVINPLLSIITNIGYDHMAFLGNTLEKIAAEKAGIIKKGIPVIIGESKAATDKVFVAHSKTIKAPIVFADTIFDINHFRYKINPSMMLEMDVIKNNEVFLPELKTPLAGLYQLKNSVTVLQAIDILREKGYIISDENIRSGFRDVVKNTGLKGRWQVIGRKPLTICDTGHNIDGILQVVRQFRFIPHDKLHIVFGMVNDKDIDHILEVLPRSANYYFCKPDIPRGLDAKILMGKANSYQLVGKACGSVKQALDAAKKVAGENDLIFVGGSTFVVAEVV